MMDGEQPQIAATLKYRYTACPPGCARSKAVKGPTSTSKVVQANDISPMHKVLKSEAKRILGLPGKPLGSAHFTDYVRKILQPLQPASQAMFVRCLFHLPMILDKVTKNIVVTQPYIVAQCSTWSLLSSAQS